MLRSYFAQKGGTRGQRGEGTHGQGRERRRDVEGLQVKWRRSLGEVKGRLLQAGEA